MALTFPLSQAAFADRLGIEHVKWKLQDNRQFSGLGSGQILGADLAPSLWTGDVTIGDHYHAKSREMEALINAIIRSQGTFYLYDPRHKYPASDPKGSALAAFNNVQINSLPDSKSMSLKNLPANFKLPVGTYLSWDYGTDPVRRAFHDIAEEVTASAGGVSPVFEVSPFIRTGALVNQVVTLKKPSMKCIITPGSFDPGSSTSTTSRFIFSVMQKV